MVAIDDYKVNIKSDDGTVGSFVIGPLPSGYGITLSNSLRRILLSSIPGAAVTAVKIAGVKHEYSTLEGLQEDIIALVLKLKELAIKMYTEEPRTLKLKINGKKGKVLVIKAAEFEVPSDVEIVNQDLEIATLTKDVKLEIDMTVEAGSGYTYANESKRQEIGVIPVDSIFSPVKRVKVEVVKARVGQITNLDQINLEVYTNGAISPTEALLNAAEMYDRLSNRLVELLGGDPESLKAEKALEVKEEEVKEDKILISDLNLSTRLTNSLLNSGITDLRDLVKKNKEEVSNFRGMGKKSMTELEEIMENHGLSFS